MGISCVVLGVEAAEFIEASKHGNLVPLSRCIFGDQLDPILAYRRLVKENDWDSPSFLFESVESNSQVRLCFTMFFHYFPVLSSYVIDK